MAARSSLHCCPIPVATLPISTLSMHAACSCLCSMCTPWWEGCALFCGGRNTWVLFLLLPWDTAYLFLLSCSLPRSSVMILIPTSLCVSLAKASLHSGRSTRWNERCAPTWSGGSMSIPWCCVIIAFSKILLHPTCLKPPPQTACPHISCACTAWWASHVFVCAWIGDSFFIFFSPDFVCSTPRPWQAVHLPAHPCTQKLKHLCHHKAPMNTLLMPSLRTPPLRASLCTLTEATHTHNTHEACGGWCFWWVCFSLFFFCFLFFFSRPVCLHTLLTHTQTPTSCAPTLAWPEDQVAMLSQGLDDDDHLHPHRMHHPCMPPHSFCTWPVVGTRPTMPFNPQRDCRHRTASAMKPIYRLPVSPCFFFFSFSFHFSFFFFFFFFIFSFFLFFFPSPVHLRTLLTHIQTPSSRAPALAWPEAKAATPSQGLDDDDNCLHPHRVHHPPMSPLWFRHVADHLLRHTKRPLALNCQWHEANHLYAFLPPFFFFLIFFSLSHAQRDRPAQKCQNVHECRCVIDLVFFFFCFFFLFFLFGCSTYDVNKFIKWWNIISSNKWMEDAWIWNQVLYGIESTLLLNIRYLKLRKDWD